jgi:hypothetical protein
MFVIYSSDVVMEKLSDLNTKITKEIISNTQRTRPSMITVANNNITSITTIDIDKRRININISIN